MGTGVVTGNKTASKKHEGIQNSALPFFAPVIQPKLTINEPGDIYEQEADAMADKVMRMTDGAAAGGFFKPSAGLVQRKCQHCVEEEKDKKLQRKEGEGGAAAPLSAEGYVQSLQGGKALDKNERSFFEPRMGYNLGDVRIHNDAAANQSAQNINALAYTHGNNIVFGANQYQPGTDAGKQLMAHELTHVIQQTGTVQRKPACAYEELQNEISGVGEEVKYLKALPDVNADNFPGVPVNDGDTVVVKNAGGPSTYNSVKNCTWAWVEIPGKKSTDKNYPVLHGFIESKYLKSKPAPVEDTKDKKPVPQNAPNEVIGNIAGPEIISPGGTFEYSAYPSGPSGINADLSKIKWYFKYDGGAVTQFDTSKGQTVYGDHVSLRVAIPASVKANKITLFATTTAMPAGASKETSLQPVKVAQSAHGKGTNADGSIADDMTHGDMTEAQVEALADMFKFDYMITQTDDQLFKTFQDMCTELFATGDLEGVIIDMIKQFKANNPADFKDVRLTNAVKAHSSTKNFVDEVLMAVSEQVMSQKEGLHQTTVERGKFDKRRPVFNSMSDTAGGLTITINDTWAHEVNITEYDYVDDDHFTGKLKVSIYDDFGLDPPDVTKKYSYLAGFRAWFILQHDRGYRPFVTVIEFDVPFDQSIKQIAPRKKAEAEQKAKQEAYEKQRRSRDFGPKW